MTHQRIRPPRGQKRPLWKRLLEATVLALMVAALLFITNRVFREPNSISRSAAYAEPTNDPAQRARVRRAIDSRIVRLLQPDDDERAISSNRDERDIEIGLLFGRLAIFDEEEGQLDARDRHMGDAIRRLKAAHHRDPTEAHVRDVVGKQRALARAR